MPELHRTLGLALSGGAAHGIAHIGIIDVLQGAKIPIGAIAGTSAGAVVGAYCAGGMTMAKLAEIVMRLRWKDVYKVSPGRMGLLSPAPLERLLESTLPVKRFEALKIPLKVITTDIHTGRAVAVSKGLLAPAVVASCSLPGLLPPMRIGDRRLVDGGVSCGIPTHAVRRAPVDVVLASDVNHDVTCYREPRNLLEVMAQSLYIIGRQAASAYAESADIVITPRIGNITWQDIDRAGELIELGRAEMKARLPELIELLQSSRIISRLARGIHRATRSREQRYRE